ncbi:PH domain-containing protein [Gryllotalpicola ginsengisoli]|uniref:PH domain-containing protein n=1 Tax=Gryllotalpicola ginsengisoli TaxID=444608 RepID=UPI0003B5FAFD|nr:PH domain-containing protein [Gryllotalpicola ginsengisoli]
MAERVEIDTEWNRVSPRYVWIVVVGSLIAGVVLAAAAVFVWLGVGVSWGWALLAAVVVGFALQLIFAPRRARAIGYRMREDDLLIRRGIAFLRFVAVPYGRMQLIDISRGPVSRALGLSDLRFVTASSGSDVAIPGLPADEAEALRDRLIALAETRRAGL